MLEALVQVEGAPSVDDMGAAYPLAIEPLIWMPQAKLLASDGAVDDRFGYSLSVSGDTAFVGAHDDDDMGVSSGSAYVFVRSGGTWTQHAKLLASDGAAGDHFGFSVWVSGDTAIVGARGDADKGASSGSAYVFARSGGTWTEQAKLLASDGAQATFFGTSVSLSGDTAFVGGQCELAKLLPSDGAVNAHFGNSVSLFGDTALVGALFDRDNDLLSGSAYMFVRSAGGWTELQRGTILRK